MAGKKRVGLAAIGQSFFTVLPDGFQKAVSGSAAVVLCDDQRAGHQSGDQIHDCLALDNLTAADLLDRLERRSRR